LAVLFLLTACGGSSNTNGSYGSGVGNIATPSPSASGSATGHSPTPGGRNSTPSATARIPTPKAVPSPVKGGGGQQYAPGYYTARTGTYNYSDQTSGSGASPSSGNATVAVSDGGQLASGTYRQYFALTNGSGTVTDDVRWSSANRLIQSTTFGTGGSAFECDWSPPDLDLQLPLVVSETWKTQSSCAVTAGTQAATIASDVTNTVTGTTSITVSGQPVPVFVITLSGTITITPGGTITLNATEWFSPRNGLYIKETQETKSSSPTTGPSDQTETLQLLSLTPS